MESGSATMIHIQKAGLVINPVAGQGFEKSAPAAREAITRLGWRSLVTGRGLAGEDALPGLPVTVETLDVEGFQGRACTQELARRLICAGVDALLVVGGDGTLADVASVLIQEKSQAPVFGLGTGSINAGLLVTTKMTELSRLRIEKLTIRSVPALLAHKDGQLFGVAFNDCVLGFTVVATMEGRLRDVAVSEKFYGRNIPGRPAASGTDKTRVWRAGPGSEQLVSQGREIGSVIIGLVEPAFIAKALTGGACLAASLDIPAGCLVIDYPLVQVEQTREDILAHPPIKSTYTSFDSTMRIIVRGCREGTGVNVDGNPLCLLHEEDEVEFAAIGSAVQVFKLSEG